MKPIPTAEELKNMSREQLQELTIVYSMIAEKYRRTGLVAWTLVSTINLFFVAIGAMGGVEFMAVLPWGVIGVTGLVRAVTLTLWWQRLVR